MRYPPHLLDEIRSRLPISRVVERRVKLKRAGREHVGLSPFKTERTPSFTVNDQKGFYHCFASGEHGDIFTFLMKTAGLTFPEAVEQLAAEAGVALPAPAPTDTGEASREMRIRFALEEACAFYEATLSGPEGQAAKAYLENRGVRAAEIKSFRLGYAPASKSSLKTHLGAKGFLLEEMQDAGLLIHGEGIAIPYDRFRGRLIFPILDLKQRVIAFGGRALSPDQNPKYMNSPETLLFHKGEVLFNFAAAREACRTANSMIIAEGYMDVIALTSAGFHHAAAPLGTALTLEQLRLLWTMTEAPVLCFDGDSAGRKAAFRAVATALPYLEPNRSLQFVFLPDGRDPDDMVRSGEAEALAELLEHPLPLIDAVWLREHERHPLETPEQRAALEARLSGLAAQIEHKSLRYHYITAFRERLRAAARERQQAPFQKVRRPHSPPINGTGRLRFRTEAEKRAAGSAYSGLRTGSLLASRIVQASAPPSALREGLLICALIRHPWLLDEFMEEIAELQFNDGDCMRLRDQILVIHQKEEFLDKGKMLEHLSRDGYGSGLERVQRATAHNADANFAENAGKEQVLEGWHHVLMLHGKAGVPRSLREAENDYLAEPNDENFFKLRAIVQQGEIAAS